MNIKQCWTHYKEYSESLSNNCRKLGYAAAAIGWLFKAPDGSFPDAILHSYKFLVAFFIADIFQYLIATTLLHIWIRSEEKRLWKEEGNIDGDVDKPFLLDVPSIILFYIKISALIFTYIFIGKHVFYL